MVTMGVTAQTSDPCSETGRFSAVPRTIAPGQHEGTPRLIVLSGPEPGRRFSLAARSHVIGRGEECDIQLDDSKISRSHARLVEQDGGWTIFDLGSRNGTLVNGEPVHSARRLEIGDRIQLSPETIVRFAMTDALEDSLAHRQQMEVIGQLAAGIAHDFNNLLSVISAGMAHVGSLDPSSRLDTPEVRECLDDVRAAAARASELTARMLTIARRRGRTAAHDRVDLSRLVEDALHLVRRTFDKALRVESRIEPGLFVEGDAAALHQLLMNLCINARDATHGPGTITVSLVRDREQVVLAVTDTGCGMDEKTRARVFEPFFTTKEKGAGSGLGLATVYEVTASHRGTVDVISVLGEGSSFRVRLPASFEPARRARAKRRSSSTVDGRKKRSVSGVVLVVDDQELVRRGMGRLLRAAGHRVMYAADGAEAIDLYLESTPRPDAVLLDLDMPNLSGAETLARLRAIDPDVRVVLVSGYYDEAHRQHMLASGAMDFLGKPVDAKMLTETVRLAMQMSPPP
jgi:two-component system cell cycle sensor histidine kinase/response regulator CckA